MDEMKKQYPWMSSYKDYNKGDIKWRWHPTDETPVECEVIEFVNYFKDVGKGAQQHIRLLRNRDLKTGDVDRSLGDRCDYFFDTEKECIKEMYKYYKDIYRDEKLANRVLTYKRYKKLIELYE